MTDAIPSIYEEQRTWFRSGATREVKERKRLLLKLADAIESQEQKLAKALYEDFRKPLFEAYATEIGFLLSEIRHIARELGSWSRPEKVRTPLTLIGARSRIYREPYGVTLIIAPWNYPVNLSLGPLLGAVAAGNCAVLKPSELTPRTSEVIAELVGHVFDKRHVTVVQGGPETSQELLRQPFDHIFFTGSTQIGRIVMEAAAKQLIPVTLELGGKSPCIVHADADVKLAAKRIAWGKFLNAGQTCIAPDYIVAHASVRARLVEELRRETRELFGDDVLRDGSRYTGIISERHFHRLTGLMGRTTGHVAWGGRSDPSIRVLEPTLVDGIGWQDALMEEELFGPLLPVLEYSELTSTLDAITERPKPLALYLFTSSAETERLVLERVSFGGGCINDTILHIASPYLPFGGVGPSGIGSYHGRASFEAFSHRKSVLHQSVRLDLPFRYPNFKNAYQRMKKLLR